MTTDQDTTTALPHLKVIYTGGTIGMVQDIETGALKAFQFDYLREHVPELDQLHCTFDIEVYGLAFVKSLFDHFGEV